VRTTTKITWNTSCITTSALISYGLTGST
jgi:hypothetical protein